MLRRREAGECVDDAASQELVGQEAFVQARAGGVLSAVQNERQEAVLVTGLQLEQDQAVTAWVPGWV